MDLILFIGLSLSAHSYLHDVNRLFTIIISKLLSGLAIRMTAYGRKNNFLCKTLCAVKLLATVQKYNTLRTLKIAGWSPTMVS